MWLTALLHILPKSHTVMEDFCDGHRVTGSLAARSRGHWQFLVTDCDPGLVTDCDPGRSSKYGAYWSDHPLRSVRVVSTRGRGENLDWTGPDRAEPTGQ